MGYAATAGNQAAPVPSPAFSASESRCLERRGLAGMERERLQPAVLVVDRHQRGQRQAPQAGLGPEPHPSGAQGEGRGARRVRRAAADRLQGHDVHARLVRERLGDGRHLRGAHLGSPREVPEGAHPAVAEPRRRDGRRQGLHRPRRRVHVGARPVDRPSGVEEHGGRLEGRLLLHQRADLLQEHDHHRYLRR